MSLFQEFKKLNKICQKPHYKEVGNWMVRNIIREACVPMTYFLIKTPITANQVTLFALFLGVGGCIGFLMTLKFSFLLLAIFLQLSYYFDHVDGQIARCKEQVSISGMMFDFITHYIIFGAIAFALGLKGYFESGNIFYIYCGIVFSLSLISFNLLGDSKYRAFFVELLKYNEVKIRKSQTASRGRKGKILNKIFSLLHKTCEIHVIINTITLVAVFQLFGLHGINTTFVNLTWAEIMIIYYALVSFTIAVVKTSFLIVTRKPDEEFKNIFLIEQP